MFICRSGLCCQRNTGCCPTEIRLRAFAELYVNACFCSRVDMFAEKRPHWQESKIFFHFCFLFFVVFFMLLLHVFVSGRRVRWKWQMTPPRGRRWKNTCLTKIIYKTTFFYVFFGLSTWRDRMRLAWWEALNNETFRVSMKVMGPC